MQSETLQFQDGDLQNLRGLNVVSLDLYLQRHF